MKPFFGIAYRDRSLLLAATAATLVDLSGSPARPNMHGCAGLTSNLGNVPDSVNGAGAMNLPFAKCNLSPASWRNGAVIDSPLGFRTSQVLGGGLVRIALIAVGSRLGQLVVTTAQLAVLWFMSGLGHELVTQFHLPMPGNLVGLLLTFFALMSGAIPLQFVDRGGAVPRRTGGC